MSQCRSMFQLSVSFNLDLRVLAFRGIKCAIVNIRLTKGPRGVDIGIPLVVQSSPLYLNICIYIYVYLSLSLSPSLSLSLSLSLSTTARISPTSWAIAAWSLACHVCR